MDEIYWLFIVDNIGKTIFSYENHIQGTSTANTALLSHLLYALQTISKDIREDQLKGVEMGNDKFFLTKEKLTSYLFIIKTHRDADSEVINPILNEIKTKFVEKFTGQFSIDVDKKIEILNSFREDIKEIFKHKTNLEKFLDNSTETFLNQI
jgi:hypothetical protein